MSDSNQRLPDASASALPRSVAELLEAVRAQSSKSPEMAALLLEQCSITADDLAAWTRFDHPDSDSYGRAMVHDAGSFELMVMSWREGDMSAIHDHGYTMWGAVRLYGRAEHAIFVEAEGILSTLERCTFEPGSVVAVNHELIHQMGNIDESPFVSLHLYGCDERSENVKADARIFDLDEGRIQVTTGEAFFLLPEEQISRRGSEIHHNSVPAKNCTTSSKPPSTTRTSSSASWKRRSTAHWGS